MRILKSVYFVLLVASSAYAQNTSPPASSEEVETLRQQVQSLTEMVKQLQEQVKQQQAAPPPANAAAAPSLPGNPEPSAAAELASPPATAEL